MSELDDLTFDPDDFRGTARLFPLPNLVLFPHVMQPLHVFEPRYRELVEAALAEDRLLAMALLQPGWEGHYEERPPIYDTACLARIVQHHRLPDGKYNVLIVGLRRVQVVRELPPSRAFREARVQILDDETPVGEGRLKKKLLDAFRRRLPASEPVQESVEQLFRDEISLAALTDVVGYALEIEPAQKIALLAETDAAIRAEKLIEHLAAQPEPSPKARFPGGYPPPFSTN